MARATLIFRDKLVDPGDGSITEMILWQLDEPVPGCTHRFKYRLFYGYPDRPLVRYDNERAKGDHRHIEGREEPYSFTDEKQLVEDFLVDRRRLGGK
jgi:hypothetical protein